MARLAGLSRRGPAIALVAALAATVPTVTTVGASHTGELAPVPAGQDGLIAFTTDRDGQREIYTMAADGSAPTNLTLHAADDSDPAWSPDGTRIAFASRRDGDWEIYVMAADGSGVTQLTSNSVDDRRPAWSPDGARIAFDRLSPASGTHPEHEDLLTMAAAGGDERLVAATGAAEIEAAWSPDGTRLTYTSRNVYQLDTDDIWIVQPDGRTRVQLTSNEVDHGNGSAWRPDGGKLAIARGAGGPPFSFPARPGGIALLDPWGTHEETVIRGLYSAADPEWAPSGTQIAFTSGELDYPGSEEIFVASADGSGLVRLTDNTDTIAAYDGQPDWQPISPATFIPPAPVAERLLVASHLNNPTTTALVTEVGKTYRVTVRGQYQWFGDVEEDRTGTDERPDAFADAECSTSGLAWHPKQLAFLDPTGDMLDLYLNGMQLDYVAAAPDSFGCATDEAHTYTWDVTITRPGRFRFQVKDSNAGAYMDNTGVLTVEITELAAP